LAGASCVIKKKENRGPKKERPEEMRIAWKPEPKLPLLLICTTIFWMGIAELALAQSTPGQGIFHGYAKPLRAPDFTLEDVQGKTVTLQDHRGKVILLNFWATW